MKPLAPLLAFLAILFPGAAARSDPAVDRVITADVAQVKGPLNTMWKTCVGAGRANEGLRADWQRQLTSVRKECGFNYLRMHGLLGDDMGVYREDKQGRPEYNWQYIDEVYDFLLRIGTKGKVKVTLAHVPPGRYLQTVYQVGYRVNDAYAVYKDLRSPEQLTRAQVETIKAASDGRPIEQTTVVVRSDGSFSRELPLRQNDVLLITLSKTRGTSRSPSP